MELGLTFGSIGDFLAIALLIRDILSALDDCRGSVKEYHELTQALTIHHDTLREVERICNDPKLVASLSDLQAIALRITKQSQKCLAAFQMRIRKFAPSFSEDGTGNKFKDAARKLQWRLEEKDCEKFKAEMAGYTMSLQVLLDVNTVRLVQRNHEASVLQASATEDRLALRVQESGQSLKGFMGLVGKRILSKLDFVAKLGMDVRKSTSNILSMMLAISGELISIRSVILRLERPLAEEHFTLEDATGKIFPIHLRTITSWEALEYILANRFKGKRGARRIQRGRYQLQDGATHQEVDRSMEWEDAFLPYQRVAMSLMCIEGQNTPEKSLVATCPRCFSSSPGETGIEVTCQSCSMHFTRVVELEDNTILPDAPQLSDRHYGIRFGEPSILRGKKRKANNSDPDLQFDECSKCHRPSKKTKEAPNQKRKRNEEDSESESDYEDVRGFVRVTLVRKRKKANEPSSTFGADHTVSFDTIGRNYPEDSGCMSLQTDTESLLGLSDTSSIQNSPALPADVADSTQICQRANLSHDFVSKKVLRMGDHHPGEDTSTLSSELHIEIDCVDKSETPQQSTSVDVASTCNGEKATSTRLKYGGARDATGDDARKHKIPRGYSVKHWDPDEEPIFLSGSVFDYYSLGKWIYDWAVCHSGPSAIADMAGDLWLRLIELNGSIKKCGESTGKIEIPQDHEIIEDFLETGGQLMENFRQLLKTGENAMAAARRLGNTDDMDIGKCFIDVLFNADSNMARTEKFIDSTKVWMSRFDEECSGILSNPSFASINESSPMPGGSGGEYN